MCQVQADGGFIKSLFLLILLLLLKGFIGWCFSRSRGHYGRSIFCSYLGSRWWIIWFRSSFTMNIIIMAYTFLLHYIIIIFNFHLIPYQIQVGWRLFFLCFLLFLIIILFFLIVIFLLGRFRWEKHCGDWIYELKECYFWMVCMMCMPIVFHGIIFQINDWSRRYLRGRICICFLL